MPGPQISPQESLGITGFFYRPNATEPRLYHCRKYFLSGDHQILSGAHQITMWWPHRPHIPPPLQGLTRVEEMTVLGVTFTHTLSFAPTF